ncbi:MAG TPA: alpha-amylase family glycosyl hydrolase [Gaiellaceae bacterium]|nr:alpha-amylase family glycosyl hydrolase [Gaiellaceae bacterium]
MIRCASALAAAAAVALVMIASGGSATPAPPRGAELAALAKPGTAPPLASDRIYFVMTDRYANGDPSNDRGGSSGGRSQTGYDPTDPGWFHGGDFKGLTQNLQRIKDLGFNAIWITPPVANQISAGDSAGYHGYWGLDFTKVDPHLGTDQDFADFVSSAHRLGIKVIMDVVVNHTGDVVQLAGGSAYSDAPYRDCHGKVFDPQRYVGKSTFPCLAARTMPRTPTVFAPLAKAKSPAWLNDPLNYHDRGDIDFASCSETCYEQGDFYGLDDLFTEKPSVERGLAQIYASWIAKYKLDGFRIDTARHQNPGFFGLWIPQIRKAARAAGVQNFQLFGEVPLTDDLELSAYARRRGLPSVLDFPFQDAAAGYASGGSNAIAIRYRLEDDDYYLGPGGSPLALPTFLGNHDMGRAALEISQQGAGLSGEPLLRHLLLGYDLMYLLRGAPVVYYGDEVGMLGTGGDKQARQDMFPTQVAEWKTQPRVGGQPIGGGSSFDVTDNPIETRLKLLGAVREQNPALATGLTLVRRATGAFLAVSRVDTRSHVELLALFNDGAGRIEARVQTSTPSAAWTPLLGDGGGARSDAQGGVAVTVPPLGTVLLRADRAVPPAAQPKPSLGVAGDSLSDYWVATAKVAGTAPVTVAFALRRAGAKTWQRLDVDGSPPYRAFIDPARFRRNEPVDVVAIARGLDGRTAVSAVVPLRVRAR